MEWHGPSSHERLLDEMWPDDRHWLPAVLGGERVRGVFRFDADGDDLRDHETETDVAPRPAGAVPRPGRGTGRPFGSLNSGCDQPST